MGRKNQNGFVEDGLERARRGCKAAIRAEVEARYAGRLREANWLRQCVLRWRMRREVRRLLDRQAPPDGLYLAARVGEGFAGVRCPLRAVIPPRLRSGL